jgi:antitoxin PrlF
MATKITSKGQITLPKPIRERLGVRPGDAVEFVTEGGEVKIRKVLGTNPFARYRGYLEDLAGQDPDRLLTRLRGD